VALGIHNLRNGRWDDVFDQFPIVVDQRRSKYFTGAGLRLICNHSILLDNYEAFELQFLRASLLHSLPTYNVA